MSRPDNFWTAVWVLGGGAIVGAFIAGLVYRGATVNANLCAARWADSGYQARQQGGACVVRTPDGRWVPETAVREVLPANSASKRLGGVL